MKIELENVLPMDIEKRSFEIIEEELREQGICLDPKYAPIIKRAIHTAADFDYAKNLVFSDNAIEAAHQALKNGCYIVTDTTMAMAGINKRVLKKLGVEVLNFVADPDVAVMAKENGTTRSQAAIDKASKLDKPIIFAIGNAPTALVRLYELINDQNFKPALIIGVPVGFVNVVQSKELIMDTDIPYIVARGRKGGSNVAAAIVNALLYMLDETRGGNA